MTQVKSNLTPEEKKALQQKKKFEKQRAALVARQKSFNEKFRALPVKEQEAITNFFNLHNAAIWIYNNLTDEAKQYVDFCISMVNEGNQIEKESGALQS